MSTLFISVMARDLDAYLTFKRASGCTYKTELFRLRNLDRFAAREVGSRKRFNLEQVITRWVSRPVARKPICTHRDVSVARQFCLFLRRRDPLTFVPEHHLAPPWRSLQRFRPHIFSLKEIRALLAVTETIRSPRFRRETYRVLLTLLYCTGLRLGEAVRLTVGDVDLPGRTLFIATSKGRSRWVPIRGDLARELKGYLRLRCALGPTSAGNRFFVQPTGAAYSTLAASITIIHLLRRLKLKPAKGRTGPRPHDLRHTFAVQRLTLWYKEGADLQGRLPWLSAYLGHTNLLGTERYLNATGELLSVASRRFASRFAEGAAP
jgi:integrase/recombinase XerD